MARYSGIGAKTFDGMYDHEGKEIGSNHGIGNYSEVLE
jgi:hypothetical protein